MLRLIGYLVITLVNQFGFVSQESMEHRDAYSATVVYVSDRVEHHSIMNDSGCLLKENSEITRECK